jgi:alkylated DNA repair dioxygenase AlkB
MSIADKLIACIKKVEGIDVYELFSLMQPYTEIFKSLSNEERIAIFDSVSDNVILILKVLLAFKTFTTPIITEKSALRVYELPNMGVVLPLITAEIDSSLDYHPAIVVYGKTVHQQRSVSFFSDETVGYKYSGQMAKSKPLTASLKTLLVYINLFFGAKFNGILINKYENGEETIGKHSDDESSLDRTAGVVSISVGAVRKFRIRNKKTGEIVADVPTEANKIIQMYGDFQKEFTHEIPIEKRIRDTRYSFTFRKHT